MHAMNPQHSQPETASHQLAHETEILHFPLSPGVEASSIGSSNRGLGLTFRLEELVGLNPVVEPAGYLPPSGPNSNNVQNHVAQLHSWEATKRLTDRS